MKIKTTFLSVLAAVAVCASPLSVCAENRSALTPEEEAGVLAVLEKTESNDSAAYVGMIAPENVENSGSDINASELFRAKNYDVNDAYKRYYLEYFMITEYKDNPDFKALIQENDNPRVMAPSDDKLFELNKKDDGNYEISTVELLDEDIPRYNAETEDIINSLNEEALNVVHTYSDAYYMDIIYIETAQNEYAVPFFKNVSYLDPGDRLVSGTLYTVAEFMDRMDQSYTEDKDYQPYNANGEAIIGGSDIELKEYTPYVPSAMAAAKKSPQKTAAVSAENSSAFSTVILITAAAIFLSFLTAFVVLSRKNID